MRLGINTGIVSAAEAAPHMEEAEVVRRLHDYRFTSMDFSLGNTASPKHILQADDWQERADRAADAAAKYGMCFSQVHLPFHKHGSVALDPRFAEPGFAEYYDECTRRAYRIAAMVGAPWAVFHCLDSVSVRMDRREAFTRNHEYFDAFVEFGLQNGVGTAFENMIRVNPTTNPRPRYTEEAEELIEYVDSYQEPMVGICWDFGHAHLARVDQPSALRTIGKRLKCVHVDDNLGSFDDHLLPFFGKIQWQEIMPVLAEIGYAGECSLEIKKISPHAPEGLQETFLCTASLCCRCLRDFYENAAAGLLEK